jgi:hypothetical protein
MIPVFVVNVNAFFLATLRKSRAESVDFDQKKGEKDGYVARILRSGCFRS